MDEDVSNPVANALRNVIASGGVDNDELQVLLNLLERPIGSKLLERYAEWRWEGLDGVYANRVEVLDDRTVKVFGSCILVTDQTLAPLVFRIRLDDNHEFELRGRLGQSGSGALGLERRPYGSKGAFDWSDQKIDWVYEF